MSVVERAAGALPRDVLSLIAKHHACDFLEGTVRRMLAEHQPRAPYPYCVLIACRDLGPTVLVEGVEDFRVPDEVKDLAVEDWARYSVMLARATARGLEPLRFFTRASRGCNIDEARARVEDIVERALGHPGYSPTSPRMSPGYDDWEWPVNTGTTAFKVWPAWDENRPAIDPLYRFM